MGIRVEKGLFNGLGGALDDIRKNGLWPTTYKAAEATAAEVHWHDHDVHAYVMEGETDFLDAATGKRFPVMAGDKVFVPARTLHAEGEVKNGIVYLISVPEALGPEDFLIQRDEADL